MSAYDRPAGKDVVLIEGLYYKIGRHGKAFYWDGEEWRLSTKHPSIVIRHLGD